MRPASIPSFVTDLAAAVRFYRHIVGLAQVCTAPAGAASGRQPGISSDCFGAHDVEQVLAGLAGVSFATADANALHDKLIEVGVPTHGKPARPCWGGILRQAPSGQTITFLQIAGR